jgi:hypothetical protein
VGKQAEKGKSTVKAKVPALFVLGVLCLPLGGYGAEINQAPAPNDPAAEPGHPVVPASGRVTRAQFTSEVKNLEPLDSLMTLRNDKTRIAYFTEIRDMAGQTVMHRWEYNGKLMAEIPFKVGAARWRVYSTKTLDPSWVGEWKASVVDSAGSSLSVNTFTYTKAAGAPPSAPAATTPATPAQ